MKGDFSRLTFNANKHFRRVLMQQGRVQLDADWNEQTAILLHYMETLAKDLIGEHGGPENAGFDLKAMSQAADDFIIGAGHYYVDGILVELEEGAFLPYKKDAGDSFILPGLSIDNIPLKQGECLYLDNGVYSISEIKDGKPELKLSFMHGTSILGKDAMTGTLKRIATYNAQDDYPLPDADILQDGQTYLVYLDVWERHITCLEDDSIREVALGGPDTATRTKLVRQLKVTNKTPDGKSLLKEISPPPDWKNYITREYHWQEWKSQWQPASRGLLKAQAKQDQKKDASPCAISAEASYRSTENQLYRVEVHNPGKAGKATFKWSRDNGSTVTGAKLTGTTLTVDNPCGFAPGLWVELTNDNQELRGEQGTLAKIINIDSDVLSLNVTSTPTPENSLPKNELWPTKARLWASEEIIITESDKEWIALADGVQIQFQNSNPDNQYRTGDYWLIPARVATGDVEWPGAAGKPEALPPYGIEHHYAPLAIIAIDKKLAVTDLRHYFQPVNYFSQPAAFTVPPKAAKGIGPATKA